MHLRRVSCSQKKERERENGCNGCADDAGVACTWK